MALWMAMLHACGARPLDTDVRWMRMSPRTLVHHLGALGHVLYLPARKPGPASVPVRGLLAADARLAPLLRADRLCFASTITGDGPREWLTVLDAQGVPRAQLHLLPDTDYLAWDALLAAARPCRPPRGIRWTLFRAGAARRLRFATRHLAMFDVLCAHAAAPACMLSVGLARRIARDEGVRLEHS